MDYDTVRVLIASRIYQDQLTFIEKIMQLRKSLDQSPNLTPLQIQRFLRANRNASFLRQDRHFLTAAVLGKGGFGGVELVYRRTDPNAALYALKTMYLQSASKRSSYHRIAQIERDFAILGFQCPFLMRYKAVWMECNNPCAPDSFKFLMPLMHMGDLHTIIQQLHPHVINEESFTFADLEVVRTQFEENALTNIKTEVAALKDCTYEDRFR